MTTIFSSILVWLSIIEPEPSRNDVLLMLEDPASATFRTVATVWKWVAEREDVSIGQNRKYNHVLLDVVVSLARNPPALPGLSKLAASQTQSEAYDNLRIYISEETMWESLTGHGIDYKRIPRSEWILLQGIASTTSHGILQGDLGRLVGQDKRSVPKRTGCLVEKGYITKRTTLVRGTKTSKLWLKILAPSAPEEPRDGEDADAEITFSRQCLVDNLEAVSWHTRWTGDSIDYRALATTIMATCKEWSVMRLRDLKSKLGVLGMTWQMKVVSKICRFLNGRGAIQYVAAKLNNRIFKDCIRFSRDMNARDWSIFLATGKRTTKLPKISTNEIGEDDFGLFRSSNTRGSITSSHYPKWTIYSPIASHVMSCVQRSRNEGLTNPQICAMTIGSDFTRYIAGLTSSISSEHIQPENVKHLAIKSERGRPGKSSSLYWYYMADTDTGVTDDRPDKTKPDSTETPRQSANLYDFTNPPLRLPSSHLKSTFSELCQSRVPQKRGRPKKPHSEGLSSMEMPAKLPSNETLSALEPESSLQSVSRRGKRAPENKSNLGNELPEDNSGRPTQLVTDGAEAAQTATNLSPRPRGRPKGRGGSRSDQSLSSTPRKTSEARKYQCELCGGTWKNDLGLKYHLEKSKTPCNPSFKPQLATPKRAKDFSGKISGKEITTESGKGFGSSMDNSIGETGSPHDAGAASHLTDKSRQSNDPGTKHLMTSARRKGNGHTETECCDQDYLAVAGQAELLVTSNTQTPRQVDPFARANRQSTAHNQRGDVLMDGLASRHGNEMSMSTSIPPKTDSEAASSLPGVAQADISPAKSPERQANRHDARKAVKNTILDILSGRGGALPAGKTLELLIHAQWKSSFPDLQAPSAEMVGAEVQKMVKDKVLVDQWHAFKTLEGKIGKCQIITLPSLSAFAPETRALVEKIKQLYPAHILPEQLPSTTSIHIDPKLSTNEQRIEPEKTNRAESKFSGRGRRSLAADVAVLNAPVYAAQTATKREGDNEEVDGFPSKRRRRAAGKFGIADDSTFQNFWPATTRSPTSNTIPRCVSSQNVTFTLDILFQDRGESNVHSGDDTATIWPQCRETFAFERLARTMQREGWIDDSTWFSWASYHKVPRNVLQEAGDSPESLRLLVEKLKTCLDAEIEAGGLIEPPSQLSPRPIVFLNFSGGDTGSCLSTQPILWTKSDRRHITTPKTTVAIEDYESDFSSASGGATAESRTQTDNRPPVFDLPKLHSAQLAPTKRVMLASRSLTSLGGHVHDGEQSERPSVELDHNELVATFVVVRSLLGGIDKVVDWGLIVHLFPTVGLAFLRRFWAKIRKEKSSLLSKATQDFQENIISAAQSGEISLPDYDRPLEYDWKSLVQWTMRRTNQEQIQLPSSRSDFYQDYQLCHGNNVVEDWREKFFHPQSSVYSRFEAASLQPATLAASDVLQNCESQATPGTVGIARSWIRSLCCTSETEYTPQDVKDRFATLSQDTLHQNNAALKAAVDQLTRERVICKSKRTPFGGRPYRLNEGYASVLAKVAHRQKYIDAALFKADIDRTFRHSRTMRVPYTLSDGAVMALMNLAAAQRIHIKTTTVPNIPFGFEPGNYESRKYPKSYYHLDLEVEPTRSYLFNDDIDTLRTVKQLGPPRQGRGREIPQWIDFFGRLDEQRWADILSAFCFAFSTRGTMSATGICDAIAPILEPFEAHLIMEWGLDTGLFQRRASCSGVLLREWWWLVAQGPWQ